MSDTNKDAAEVPSDVEPLDKETTKSTGDVAKLDDVKPAAPPPAPTEAAKPAKNPM